MKEERIVEFPEGKIWTECLGDPSSPAVLCISGAGAHAHFWSDSFCAPFLHEGFCVVRYDHRDVGLSDPTDEEYDLSRLVNDALEILKAYQMQSAHLVAHSMGGYVAQLMASEYPDRVLSLTLLSCGPAGEVPGILDLPNREEREKLQETWRVMLENKPSEDFSQSLEGYMKIWQRLNGLFPVDETLARQYTYELYHRSNFPVGPHHKHINVMHQMALTFKERKEMFQKLHIPTLIIQGEEDYLILPDKGGKLLAKALPKAQFELVPKMGHMLFHPEVEKLVSQKILSFLLSFNGMP